MTKRDKIVGFAGSWMSGLATLILEHDQVFCDNGATVRALENAFGDVIQEPSHTVNNEAIRGKEIYYDTDFMGILEGFTPVDQWDGPEPEVDEYDV